MRLEAAMPGGHLLRMTDDVTVEHVLPKSGGAWWNERFPDSGDARGSSPTCSAI